MSVVTLASLADGGFRIDVTIDDTTGEATALSVVNTLTRPVRIVVTTPKAREIDRLVGAGESVARSLVGPRRFVTGSEREGWTLNCALVY